MPNASFAEFARLVPPRARVIIDNDFSGDPDGLVQLAHHLLSPSVEIVGVIGSHLSPGDPFDPSDRTAENAREAAAALVRLVGRTDAPLFPIVAGSNAALVDRATPIATAGTELIIREALRDDTDLPLYLACGAGLTEVASALLLEPRITDRVTLVWIGGPEHPGLAALPPRSTGAEYNLAIDILAGTIVFDSTIELWQVPRDAYRQTLLSVAEMVTRLRSTGAIGRYLFDAVTAVSRMAGEHGVHLGETYIMGDSPLVLLTALQSAFEPDPSSSAWVERRRPAIDAAGAYVYGPDEAAPGAAMRVYTRLDVRLMFDDLFAKLALADA